MIRQAHPASNLKRLMPPTVLPTATPVAHALTPPDTQEARAQLQAIVVAHHERWKDVRDRVAFERDKEIWDSGFRSGVEATLKHLGANGPVFPPKPVEKQS